jgi:hypothetical protein
MAAAAFANFQLAEPMRLLPDRKSNFTKVDPRGDGRRRIVNQARDELARKHMRMAQRNSALENVSTLTLKECACKQNPNNAQRSNSAHNFQEILDDRACSLRVGTA